jgi:aminoglycoside phosphotransferase (APT) family kinase protein
VLAALARAGFPVARVYGLCQDDAVIGTAFYIMDCVEGRVIWDATFPQVARSERAKYFDALNETLARLHLVDYQAIGLGDFGKPGSYFARQIARWSKQYLEDVEAGRDATLDRLIEWLPAHIPPGEETALVHGDFRCDNVIFHPSEPRVLAVLDWELSTLGHPLADFSYHAMMYRIPPVMIAGLLGADLPALGIPSEQEYVGAYCRRTGRAGLPGYDFAVAFNLFRFAAILHGIRGRVVRGTAASSHAKQMAANVELFARLGWEQAERVMRA